MFPHVVKLGYYVCCAIIDGILWYDLILFNLSM